MTDKKLTELDAAASVDSTDLTYGVVSGVQKKVAISKIREFVAATANLFTKAQTFQPDSDAQSITARRFSSSQTAKVVEIQTEANATLASIDRDGKIAAPAVALGTAGSVKGALTLSGNTSGTVTIQPAAAAGTYSLTLPTTDGNASEYLQTDGNGVLTWAAGPVGPAGSTGAAGADGKTVLSGAVNPTTEGVNGDFYINTTSWQIFGPKASGTWPSGVDLIGATGAAGAAGSAGADGKTVLSGASDPTTQGVNGDFYVNTTSWQIFGPKASGTWPSGVSLIGPAGSTGSAGAAGAAATIAVGTVTTGAAGSSATVTNSGTSSAAVFDFAIPQGAKGDKGDTGNTGAAGPSTVTIDTTATSGGASGRLLYDSGSVVTESSKLSFDGTTLNAPGVSLGVAGSTLGTLKLSGNTSGTVTVQPAAAAGTYSLTLPNSAGSANQVLTTDGSGALSWTTPSSSTSSAVSSPAYLNAYALGAF